MAVDSRLGERALVAEVGVSFEQIFLTWDSEQHKRLSEAVACVGSTLRQLRALVCSLLFWFFFDFFFDSNTIVTA